MSIEERLRGRIQEYSARLEAERNSAIRRVNTLATEITDLYKERIQELEARVLELEQELRSREVNRDDHEGVDGSAEAQPTQDP